MEFREITTREAYSQILPVVKQDWGDEDFGSDERVIDNFLQAIKYNYRQFAAYDGGEVVAVTGMLKSYMPVCEAPVYDLFAFVVNETHRGKGVGSQLIAHCKKVIHEEGGQYLRTCAYKENYKAQAFYQKNGFKHTANFMFCDLEDAVEKKGN